MIKIQSLAVSCAAAFLLFAVSACKCTVTCSTEKSEASLSHSDHDAIAANSAAWLKSVRAADWSALAATYATDAMLLPPNQPAVSGREEIRKWFAAFPPISAFELNDVEIEGCSTVAYVRGTYHLTITPPGQAAVHETGKYIEIRRKEPDGQWLTVRDMFSSDEPAPH